MSESGAVERSPIPALPQVHHIVLPTPWIVGPVQVHLVESEPLTLIDTGVRTPDSRAALETALDQLGFGLGDLERIVLTHWHGDHLGQAQTIREIVGDGLEVWCHEDEAVWCEEFSRERDVDAEGTAALFRDFGVPEEIVGRQLERFTEWQEEDPLCEATRIDRVVSAGDRIGFKDLSLEVIHAPGHTEGHMLLHEPESGTLFTGDHVMGGAVPFTANHYLEGAPDPRDPLARRPRFSGLALYMDGLRELRRTSFRTILPAHGGILDRPARAIEEARLFYEVRVQRIERAFAKLAEPGAPVTAWEIWRQIFPKADPISEMRNRMFMVLGALDLLERDGRATPLRREDGVLAYRPAKRDSR